MDQLLHPCKTAEVYRAKLPKRWDCVSNQEVSRRRVQIRKGSAISMVLLMESYLLAACWYSGYLPCCCMIISWWPKSSWTGVTSHSFPLMPVVFSRCVFAGDVCPLPLGTSPSRCNSPLIIHSWELLVWVVMIFVALAFSDYLLNLSTDPNGVGARPK